MVRIAAVIGRRVRLGAPLGGIAFPVDTLEQRIALELSFHIGGEVQMGELEQLDRLQQLRRHHQGLALADLQPLHQSHSVFQLPLADRRSYGTVFALLRYDFL
jgi:hypothetical protein